MNTVAQNSDEAHMREALRLAKYAIAIGNIPIVALLVLQGEVIASSSNMMTQQQNLLGHAELLVMQIADALAPRLKMAQRQELSLIVNLEPCRMCLGAAINFNIGRLAYALESPEDGVFSVGDQWRERDHLSHSPCRVYGIPDIIAGVLRVESARLFHVFAEQFPASIYAPWARRLAALAGGAGVLAGDAVKPALDAVLEKLPLDDAAQAHQELRVALETWGYGGKGPRYDVLD